MVRQRLPVLTDEQWSAVLAAAEPQTPSDPVQARIEVEECLTDFIGLCHFNAADLKWWREKWQRVDELADELGRTLHEIKRRSPWGSFSQVQRDIVSLKPLRERAPALVEGFAMTVHAWAGKQNPIREWLYWRLMGVWTSAFHGRLVIATSSAGVPGGPLVRFLCTATEFGLELAGEHLAPRLIKGGPLSVDAVRDAIRRERRRRGKRHGVLTPRK